jgi:hypothetical protein
MWPKCQALGSISSTSGKGVKKKKKNRCWWLMPLILATWEAEIRRIKV